MTGNIEVFENEEAERFLDYFVAYRKISCLMDNAKCIAAVNFDIRLNNFKQTLQNSNVNDTNDLTLSANTIINK